MHRDMTMDDKLRLRAHVGSHKLFKAAVEGRGGYQLPVSVLSPSQWANLRTLVELDFVDVIDGRLVVRFTASSLMRMGYLS